MNLRTIHVLFLVVPLLLVACGDSGPDMKAGFVAELPTGWELESFKITASEEVGTKVSPVSQHRFVAEVSPGDDLFQHVATLLDRDVLKRVHEKGSDVEVHGIGVAAFTAGKWETHYQLENSPFFSGGKTANSFRPNQVVIGTSEYRSLMESTKGELEKLQEQSNKLSVDIQKKMAELQAVTAESQTRVNQSSELVARAQQLSRERNSGEYQAYSKKVQEINTMYAGEHNTKRAEFTAAFNKTKGTLDAQYAATVKQIRAERTEAGNSRQTERRRVHTEYNATITDARRKKLDAASLATVKSTADAQARAEYDAIEAQTRQKIEALGEREAKATADYRAEVGRLQTEHTAAVNAMTQEVTARRDAELAAEKQKYEGVVAASSGELTEAQNAYNAVVKSSNERRNQMGAEINNMRGQLNNYGKNIQSLQEVLAFLQSSSG
jgi:hypothetical protein